MLSHASISGVKSTWMVVKCVEFCLQEFYWDIFATMFFRNITVCVSFCIRVKLVLYCEISSLFFLFYRTVWGNTKIWILQCRVKAEPGSLGTGVLPQTGCETGQVTLPLWFSFFFLSVIRRHLILRLDLRSPETKLWQTFQPPTTISCLMWFLNGHWELKLPPVPHCLRAFDRI